VISIGIDIGRYSVKVAVLEGSARGYQLKALDEIPLTIDPAKDQTFDILEALREIKKRYIVGEDVPIVLAARQSQLSTRRKQFPFRERHKILKSLPFELEDDIPLSPETAVFEAKITHIRGGQPQVLAMACPKTHIQQKITQAKDAGIEPSLMSSEAVAIANLFEDWREAPLEQQPSLEALPESSPADLVLHLGHTQTVGVLFRDGYMLDAFAIDWGGKDLIETIALKYSLHFNEAQKELKKKAFLLLTNEGANRDQIALSDFLKATVDEFVTPLRFTLLELQTQNGVRIQKATLSGGTAGLRNLGPYLTQKLEIPCNRVESVVTLPGTDFTANTRNEIAHVVAIGLAAEGLRRPKNPAVNFLRDEFAQKSESLRLLMTEWAPAMTAAMAFFVAFFLWAVLRDGFSSDMLTTAEDRLKTHAKNVANLTGRQASERNIRKFIREQEMKIKQREVLDSLKGIQSGLDLLNRVSTAAPGKNSGLLNISKFHVDHTVLRLTGFADRQDMINKLQNSLKGVASDGVVEVTGSQSPVPAGQKGFQMSLKLNRKAGSQP
jgi:general secretion pathway protein L